MLIQMSFYSADKGELLVMGNSAYEYATERDMSIVSFGGGQDSITGMFSLTVTMSDEVLEESEFLGDEETSAWQDFINDELDLGNDGSDIDEIPF